MYEIEENKEFVFDEGVDFSEEEDEQAFAERYERKRLRIKRAFQIFLIILIGVPLIGATVLVLLDFLGVV